MAHPKHHDQEKRSAPSVACCTANHVIDDVEMIEERKNAKHEPPSRIESLANMVVRALQSNAGTSAFLNSFDAEGVKAGLAAAAKRIAAEKQALKDQADRMAFTNPNLYYDCLGFRVHFSPTSGDGQAYRRGIRAGLEAALGLPLTPPGTIAERDDSFQRTGPNSP